MTGLARLLILTLLIGCVALFSGAVAQEYGGGQTPTVAAAGNETNATNVTIVSPEMNASVAAGNVTIEVNVTNFTLVEPTGQPNVPGEGHLHYYLDAVVPTNASAPAIPETGGYVISTNLSHVWENVTPGEHNLSVQLVNNDHTPLIPLVFETVNITVDGNATGNATGNVTPAAAAAGGAVTVDITAADFEFDTETITVPAGAEVTMVFNNQDDGVPHNVAIYESSAQVVEIFVGEVITGPAEITYTFTAPSEPGTYYFQCDVHPEMNGEFIVE
jgi:plastocyanin